MFEFLFFKEKKALLDKIKSLESELAKARWEMNFREEMESKANIETTKVIMKHAADLSEQLDEYKRKYADEVQKRLELAKLVGDEK